MTLQEVFDPGDDRGEDMPQDDSTASQAIGFVVAAAAGMFASMAAYRMMGDATTSAYIGGATLCIGVLILWRQR